ncbi:hypothetical protein MCG98_11900 [Ruminococcus sp. OA3]|uniref:hypothetical protein n=1 Tax=Ruminococcus sp. OA3 TaxID=2914164 RepID=UPI001F05D49C|nr:hypothetical protein [Ruminococcus sp. OA3]MCH1983266.1 hypothetical protein [Ruminococcus sp. OA3]
MREIRKKRFLNTALSLATVLILCLTACGRSEQARKKDTEVIKVQEADDERQQKGVTNVQTEGGEEDKSETVYTKASADGTALETTVQTLLKNRGGDRTIKDFSNLTDIKNTEGDEEFTLEPDGTLYWTNRGQDIQYEGKSGKELPVTVSISYFLNGKKMEPRELAGMSGNLRIRFDYENHTSREVEINGREMKTQVPFTVISALLLPEDMASDVQVKNGKVVSIGEQMMVIGYACPGLSKSLKLADYELTEEISLPEYVEITAAVTDFKLDFTASIVSTGLFDEAEESDLDDLESVSEDMTELGKASGELVDGAAELFEGIHTYRSYLEQYMDGVSALTEGTKMLEQSLALADEKKGDLASGASAIQQGLENLNEALEQVKLTDNTGWDMKEIESTLTSLVSDAGKLGEALSAMQTGFTQIQTFVQQAAAYRESVQSAVDDALNDLNQADLDALEKQASDLAKSQAGEAAGQAVDEALASLNLPDADKSQIRETVKSRVQNAVDLRGTATGMQKHLDAVRAKLTGIPPLEIPDLTIDASAVTEVVLDMQKQMEILGTFGKAMSGMAESMSAMADNLDTMKDGTRQLLEGSTLLTDGLRAFNEGIGQIYAGAGELGSAAGQLSSSGAVMNGGFGALADGMRALKEGLETFDEEGIAQLKELAGDDLKELSERLKAVKQADSTYDNFGGILDGQRGSVRFMIETEGIGT